MRTSEGLDWLQFSCIYCKDASDYKKSQFVHYSKFGDPLIRAFLDPSVSDRADLIADFADLVVPAAWHNYFDFSICDILPKTVKGYAFSFRIGDPEKFSFVVRIPLRQAFDQDFENNYFILEHTKQPGLFLTYNEYVGLQVVFSGKNIPFDRFKVLGDYKQGTKFPIRFQVAEWVAALDRTGTDFRISRCDVCLDVDCWFTDILDIYNSDPNLFRMPFMKKNRRVNFNAYTGEGQISCGVRGHGNGNYLRIYNKGAECKHNYDYYPWDDPYKDETTNTSLLSIGLEVPWTRIEFELRGSNAALFLLNYFDAALNDIMPGRYVFDFLSIHTAVSDAEKNRVKNGQLSALPRHPFWDAVVNAYNLAAKAYNENFVQFREELSDAGLSPSAVAVHLAHTATPYRTGLRLISAIDRIAQQILSWDPGACPDRLSVITKAMRDPGAVIDLISAMPTEFADEVTLRNISQLQHALCISKERANALLSDAGLKGFAQDVLRQQSRLVAYSDADFDDVDDVEEFEMDPLIVPDFVRAVTYAPK